MQTLTEFIAEKVAIARDYRGLSSINPVEIVVEGNGKKFVILVSTVEPDTVTVPFNVLWINADENHEDYMVIMRRVDAEKYDDKNYRGVWSVLTSVAELFTEEQYFNAESDPILGEVVEFRPAFASPTRLGGFRTSLDRASDTQANTRFIVGSNDVRMRNKRAPKVHSHPVLPASMLRADGEKTVNVTSINDPVAGDILVITGTDNDGNYIGQWTSPAVEFPYIGPLPVSLTVVGPSVPVEGNSGHVLRADVRMDDNSVISSVPVVWTVQTNAEFASIGRNTGVFRSLVVAVDTVVVVRATWTHVESGEVVYVDFPITILGDSSVVQLQSIMISGRSTFDKAETEQYTIIATYSDASEVTVTPNLFTSSVAAAGAFVGGLLDPLPSQKGNVSTVLNASFTANGVTRTATLSVTVSDSVVYPASLAINGANAVNDGATSQYTMTVTRTDGSTGVVAGTWEMVATTYATVSVGGLLTAKPITVQGNKSATLRATYIAEGVTVTITKAITITDTNVWPVAGAVAGSANVSAGATSQYTYSVSYTDSTNVIKTPVWSVSNPAAGSIDADGLFTAAVVGLATNANIVATFSEAGKNLNATRAISVGVVALPAARWGKASFSNREFTGGPIASEITAEELDYGVDADLGLFGTPYTRWAGFEDFQQAVMVNTITPATDNHSAVLATTTLSDQYLYLMWDARAGNVEIIDTNVGFVSVWEGILWRNVQLGNYEGLPGYDANLPKVMTIDFDDGDGVRPWKIVRLETTPMPQFSPLSVSYSVKYVP